MNSIADASDDGLFIICTDDLKIFLPSSLKSMLQAFAEWCSKQFHKLIFKSFLHGLINVNVHNVFVVEEEQPNYSQLGFEGDPMFQMIIRTVFYKVSLSMAFSYPNVFNFD